MAELITTLGKKSRDELGMILPHEHIFVDLRTYEAEGFGEADAADVIAMMAPEIEKIKALNVTALVECSPVGVARRADMDLAVSKATDFPVVVPTGIYREPWIPPWAHAASEDELYEWMMKELTDQIEESGVQAAWIKVSAGDDGITETETKILRAAARAGKETNAIIGSHTIRQRVVNDQLDIIEAMGYTPERYIWIHTQSEADVNLHLEIGARGAWLEYDNIGGEKPGDAQHIDNIKTLLDAGYGDKLMLSHDRGWYDPGTPNRVPKPFTYISETFIPKMREAGIDDATIVQLTHDNPFNAYAR